MRLSTTMMRRLPVALLLAGSLLLAAACGEEPTPTAEPTAAVQPTDTPVPTPTPTVEERLAVVGESIANMESAKFSMVDETGTGALFFGTTFKSMEAEVEAPDSVKMQVEVETPNFGFVQISIVKVGEQAFLKFSKDAPWSPIPTNQVPFEFAGMAVVFSTLPRTIQDATITGREEMQGAQTIRIEGGIDSGELLPLITSGDPGYPITLTLWIDEAEALLRQVRLAGQVYDEDGPETTRLLVIEDINVPVDIELPDIASGQ